MSNRNLVLIVILAVIVMAVLIHNTLTYATYYHGNRDTLNITLDPIQIEDRETVLPTLQFRGSRYDISIRAKYVLTGLLVSKHAYPRGLMKDVSPYDYAIAWGKVPEWLPHLKFAQAKRYCLYNYKIPSPVNKSYLDAHMSNNHMIPSTPNLRHALSKAKKGEIVQVEGYLVNIRAQFKNGRTSNWNTSLIRSDTGAGACEIIYVKRLQIGAKIYE